MIRITSIAILLLSVYAYAARGQQADIYIHPGTSLFFFNEKGAGIFGNMHVAGNMGQQTGSRILFYGQHWINGSSAFFPDETSGGTGQTPDRGGMITFSQPHPLRSGAHLQTITGGYESASHTGISMPSIGVANPSGLLLHQEDLAIRNLVHLESGHLFLNNNDLVVGSMRSPGSITGYGEHSFVVTGAAQAGGRLTLSGHPSVPGDTIIFPLGTDDTSYTPAALINRGTHGMFSARVFEGVFAQGITGNSIPDSSAGKTWVIEASEKDIENVSVYLQHRLEEEGHVFRHNRTRSYISHLQNGQWDTPLVAEDHHHTHGWITTRNPIQNGIVHTRAVKPSATGGTMILTKLLYKPESDPCTGLFTYFVLNRLSPLEVRLHWGVISRPGLVVYHVEKRIGRNGDWKTVAVIQADNSFDYTWTDDDAFHPEPVFYRIRVECLSGEVSYSGIRQIAPGDYAVVYPSPTEGPFTLTVTSTEIVKKVIIYSTAGRHILTRNIEEKNTHFDISHVASGIYMIRLLGQNDLPLQTIKLLKIGT